MDIIRTRPQPACILCCRLGVDLYRNLADRLFGVGGSWSFKQCSDPSCGLVWLDPMPLTEDLGKAYANYYTHAAPPSPQRDGHSSALKQYCRNAQSLYVRRRFGYANGRASGFAHCLGGLLHFYRTEASSTFLASVPGGKLLDVGCGSGAYLAAMRHLGWAVAGVDFDPAAVAAARRAGLDVNCGSLEAQQYPAAAFDAVALSHVVEHLPDPVATLQECARILKPGGRLLLFTPNTASLGHRLFREDWRGLEPPRHLFLFSAGSMDRLLRQAGFAAVTIRPQVGSSLIYESSLLRRGVSGPFAGPRRHQSARLLAHVVALLEMGLQPWQPRLADCLGVMAVKHYEAHSSMPLSEVCLAAHTGLFS